MNKYTKKSMFTESAEYILNNSELLIKSDCKIVDDVLYECLESDDAEQQSKDKALEFKHKYRFFFNCDDYDYVEDAEMIAKLDAVFAK